MLRLPCVWAKSELEWAGDSEGHPKSHSLANSLFLPIQPTVLSHLLYIHLNLCNSFTVSTEIHL